MTWRSRLRLAPLAIVVASFAAAAFAAMAVHAVAPEQNVTERPACAVPQEMIEPLPELPHLAAAIRRRMPVRIVVIGGASTKGAAAGLPENAYPHRLQMALQHRFPEVPITVVNQGLPWQTASQMVRRFPVEISEDEPTLIIWEVGITDAARGGDLDEFTNALQAGIDLAKNRAIDIMLIDMQFSRRTTAIIDFNNYLDTIHRVGEMNDIYVFPRFAIMRHWSDEKVFDYDGISERERVRLAREVYECLGRALADVIAGAVR